MHTVWEVLGFSNEIFSLLKWSLKEKDVGAVTNFYMLSN